MSDRLALLRPFLADAMAHAMAIQQCEQRAADSVQQVLAKAMSLSDMPHESQHLKAWFLRSVHNAAIDVIRHERKEQPIDSETEEQSAPVSIEPDCQLETWQTQQWVRTGLQKLSTEQREILVLRDINGCSYADIAVITGLEPGTVMSRIHRARLALKHRLETLQRGKK
ncbi:RNA polymerase sigma-70 factor, ECF subfamily [Pseudidiomarina maritima]|uniref:RNA polymerase sigma-70 factor, ECF subfamily n=1 Tax=Pseudidiomarina maritima TaxID=519453 RepID=A0A1I6GC93_9GAMM|nr:RNA polymerase sigma factor [Pseudidiomarina maritima]SFR39823.1 RNA polymerase sigma-70 factor, ECF subfamily [Pseudidiomarina maritima]